MANTSIYAAFERMWQHIVTALGKKSDLNHSHEASEIEGLEEQLKEISQMKPSITLPAGRVKGDVNGDGSVDSTDASIIEQYTVELRELSGVDLWVADMNGDGVVDSVDASLLLQYIVEDFSNIPEGILSDYYGNWEWDSVKHCYYYDAHVSDITSSHSAIVFMDKATKHPIIGAECMNGLIRVYSESVPVVDINCNVICSLTEGETIVVGSQNTEEVVDVYVQDEEPVDVSDDVIWIDLSEEGSNGTTSISGIPTITAEDEDKLIQVVDGRYVLVSIGESSIATYVDDYINEALGGDY